VSQKCFPNNIVSTIVVPTAVYCLSSIIHESDRRSFQRISYLYTYYTSKQTTPKSFVKVSIGTDFLSAVYHQTIILIITLQL